MASVDDILGPAPKQSVDDILGPDKKTIRPSDLFAPGKEKELAAARSANIAAIPGQLYGLGYGAANTILGGAGELENFARQTVPEFFGAKPLYNAGNVMGDKSETFFPTMAQVKDVATTVGIPAPKETSAETVGEFLPLVKPTVALATAVAPKVISVAKAGAKKIASPIVNILENYNSAKTAEPIAQNLKNVLGPQSVEKARIVEEQAIKEAEKNKKIAVALRGIQKGTGEPVAPGKIAFPTEIGSEGQAAALARMNEIEKTKYALDKEYRTARDELVSDLEAKGKAPEKTKAYKELIGVLKPVVQYKIDPAKSPSILKEASEPVQKLYQRIWDSVVTKKIELSPEQAAEAKKLGYKVQTLKSKGGEQRYFREFAKSFDAFDDARRFLGKVFSGNPPAGYEAISGIEKERLYDLFKRIQNEYAGSAQVNLQSNWANASKQLEAFDTKAGKILTGMQGETGAMRTTAAEVPNKFFGKGQGKFQEYVDYTNPQMAVDHAQKWLRSQIEGKSADQVKKILSDPTSQVNDMLQHPALKSVRDSAIDYYKNLAASEQRGVRLGQALKDYEASSQSVAKSATPSRQTLEARMKQYDAMPTDKFVNEIFGENGALIKELKAGRITQQEYNDLSAQAQEAMRLFGKTETAKKKIKTILTIAGTLGLGSAAVSLGKKSISD